MREGVAKVALWDRLVQPVCPVAQVWDTWVSKTFTQPTARELTPPDCGPMESITAISNCLSHLNSDIVEQSWSLLQTAQILNHKIMSTWKWLLFCTAIFLAIFLCSIDTKRKSSRNSTGHINYKTHKNSFVVQFTEMKLVWTWTVFGPKWNVLICVCDMLCVTVCVLGGRGIKLDFTENKNFKFYAPCRKCYSFALNYSVTGS